MIELFLGLLFTALWIWGVHCLFQPDHLLEKWGDWIDDNTPDWIYKPTVGCPACMSSVHGILWFIVGLPVCFDMYMPIRLLIPFLIALCGFNFVIIKFTTKERIIVEE